MCEVVSRISEINVWMNNSIRRHSLWNWAGCAKAGRASSRREERHQRGLCVLSAPSGCPLQYLVVKRKEQCFSVRVEEEQGMKQEFLPFQPSDISRLIDVCVIGGLSEISEVKSLGSHGRNYLEEDQCKTIDLATKSSACDKSLDFEFLYFSQHCSKLYYPYGKMNCIQNSWGTLWVSVRCTNSGFFSNVIPAAAEASAKFRLSRKLLSGSIPLPKCFLSFYVTLIHL